MGNAALSVFSPIWAVGYCLGLLSGVGSGVLFGNAHGKGDEESAQAAFGMTVLFGAVLSVMAVLTIGIFRMPLLSPVRRRRYADTAMCRLSFSDPVCAALLHLRQHLVFFPAE